MDADTLYRTTSNLDDMCFNAGDITISISHHDGGEDRFDAVVYQDGEIQVEVVAAENLFSCFAELVEAWNQ